MPYWSIPEGILDKERTLTAEEIALYKIDAGIGGTLEAKYFRSARPELAGYRFYLKSTTNQNGMYYLTIRLDKTT
uniref:Uncharacterized protein n=1 Tax=viral metagenome TaxID=1070528 RepID=A0A6C0KUY4_9ZZZZ